MILLWRYVIVISSTCSIVLVNLSYNENRMMIYISSINIMIDCNVKIIKYEKDKRLIGVSMIF